jgi:D-alanyl-lipoteichoic acid acyltransferase DltB (MBOAT superfamily)
VDDDRRFLYALTAGCAVSGLLFWLAFWHGRVLLGTAWGLTVCVLLRFRYGGPSYRGRLRQHGTRREIRQFKATFVVFALVVVGVAVFLTVEGLLK